jgi:hypothetical protein
MRTRISPSALPSRGGSGVLPHRRARATCPARASPSRPKGSSQLTRGSNPPLQRATLRYATQRAAPVITVEQLARSRSPGDLGQAGPEPREKNTEQRGPRDETKANTDKKRKVGGRGRPAWWDVSTSPLSAAATSRLTRHHCPSSPSAPRALLGAPPPFKVAARASHERLPGPAIVSAFLASPSLLRPSCCCCCCWDERERGSVTATAGRDGARRGEVARHRRRVQVPSPLSLLPSSCCSRIILKLSLYMSGLV